LSIVCTINEQPAQQLSAAADVHVTENPGRVWSIIIGHDEHNHAGYRDWPADKERPTQRLRAGHVRQQLSRLHHGRSIDHEAHRAVVSVVDQQHD
jgi:hypothetical protein